MKCKIKNSKLAKESIALQGLTQSKMSDITGISESFLSQVLNGKRTCTGPTAMKIAVALNSDVKTQFDAFV
ncbi:helix-turn-helix domain-containing protein [Levilactobacillus yonginensis]|uniref:helix-turn-helix domain-containing protein n=1 Tax=Levilactobacillus yonginensis TaxID=1054041 RepID=UPI00345D4529